MPFGPLYCKLCGKDYVVERRSRLTTSNFCSRTCRARGQPPEVHAKKGRRGDTHPRFVPIGTRREWDGCPGVAVKTEHGWEREHRVVARPKPRQVVHHLDGDPTNNDAFNLIVMSQAEHARMHMPERVRDTKGRLT